MKFFIFIALVASVSAVPYGGLVNTGASAVSRSEDGYGNYAFGYNEDHATGGSFRKEKGGPGVQVGSYGLRDADGRMRVVNYVADALGYRATISSNEPGVDAAQPAAATTLNGHAPLVAPLLHAPIAHAPAVAVAAAPVYAEPLLAKSYAAPILAEPVLAKAAYAAPLYSGYSNSYAVNTAHAAPLYDAPHGLY